MTSIGYYNGDVISATTNAPVATLIIPETGSYGPAGIAYDSGKHEIFIANSSDNTVKVISDSTDTVIATVPVGIPVGKVPMGIVYDSGKGKIFVTNSTDGTVSVIA